VTGAPDTAAAPRRATLVAIVLLLVLALAGAAAYFTLRAPAPAQPSKVADVARTAAEFVGRAQCAGCHAQEEAAWKGSDHDLAMQVADEHTVLGDFANAKFAYAGTTSTFFRRDGKYYVSTDGPDGKLHDYEIRYTFGVHPLQQYLIEFPGGRMQALGIAWDSRPKEAGGGRWFHLYPGQNVKAGDFLHWTAPGQNWNFMCSECHSTNLRKGFDAKSGTFHTTWSELDVSCEACHGPGSTHVAWANKQGDYKAQDATKGLVLALDERKGVTWLPKGDTGNSVRSAPRQASREIDTCARCHARASRLSDDYAYGKSPLDTHRLARLDDGLYWNDGQMHDEVYNWGSFVQSRMHAAGVTCSDCHDPHSLKLRAPGNAVCAQCHSAARFDAPAHTHHAPGSAGAACAACHMPTTTYMVIDARHDHSMRIPRPDVSAKLGMPNACSNCHRKEKPQWAADAIRQWTGKPPASFQNFAEAFHDGAQGGPHARGALMALIDDKTQPAIVRASAIDRLGRLLTPATLDALTRSLNDPDPLVRLATVEALAAAEPVLRQRYLPRMLGDPILPVRIEAARGLAGQGEGALSPDDRARLDRAIAEYIGVQTYNADRPEARMSLGNLAAARGDPAAAIAEYRNAIEIDPTFVQAYVNLAEAYRNRGAEGEADVTLRQGLARNPRTAVLHHALGLSLVRQKRLPDAVPELREANKLAPDDARFAYVYAVALLNTGKAKDAQAVVDAAIRRNPYDRSLNVMLVRFDAANGNLDGARVRIERLRELDPESSDYDQLEAEISPRS
jgi:predicted CXXCH cytochrome family protein